MNRKIPKTKLSRAASANTLFVLALVICAATSPAQDDPLLDEPEIVPTGENKEHARRPTEFVVITWAYEQEVQPSATSSGGGADSLLGGLDDVAKEMDRTGKRKPRTVKAALSIPVAALVDRDRGFWRATLVAQRPVVDIHPGMPASTAKALDQEVDFIRNRIGRVWDENPRRLTTEEARRLLSDRELTLEVPDSLNTPGKLWARDGKVMLKTRLADSSGSTPEAAADALTFRIRPFMDGTLKDEVKTLQYGIPYVIEATFEADPEHERLGIRLDWAAHGATPDDLELVRVTEANKTFYRAVKMVILEANKEG